MNENQKYGFDVWGFLPLPGVLDGDEIASCAKALSSGKPRCRRFITSTSCFSFSTALPGGGSRIPAPKLARS